MLTEEEADIHPDSVMEGFEWKTFLAKTFACLIFTAMSIYIVVTNWNLMDTSTYIEVKVTGCIISFFLLIPSLRETIFLTTFIANTDNESLEGMFSVIQEDIHCLMFLFVLCCCPCIMFAFMFYRVSARTTVCFIIAFVDSVQTLMLFPLSVVVILTSESEVDVFVNLVAVQVFANLDDIFAFGLSKWLAPKVVKHASTLYIRWKGGTKKSEKSEYDSLKKEVNLLTEKVQFLEKHGSLDDVLDNKEDAGDASKGQLPIIYRVDSVVDDTDIELPRKKN